MIVELSSLNIIYLPGLEKDVFSGASCKSVRGSWNFVADDVVIISYLFNLDFATAGQRCPPHPSILSFMQFSPANLA